MSYKQLIEDTIVPSNLSNNEKNERYKSIVSLVNQMLPSKLYRFRSCSEIHISAFMNDELWFSNGSSVNDDFDARLYYDKKHILQWLDSFVDEDGCLKVLNQLSRMSEIPEGFNLVIPNVGQVFSVLKSLTKEQIETVSMQTINLIKNNLDAALKDITKTVQSKTKFACFSKKIDSDMMWGHYADNGTGFALEYQFGCNHTLTYKNDVDSRSIIWGNLFPIIYGNQRMDTTIYAIYLFQIQLLWSIAQARGVQVSQQLINAMVICPDEFMVTKLAIKKSTDWKREQEWRMFYVTNDAKLANEQYSCVKQKPSALYLGRKISELHQKILCDMAREKGIPVFKMDFNDNSRTYRLRKYKLKI